MSMSLKVNGAARTTMADPATPLLDVLRNEFRLTGTRYGCGQEQCGACLVLVDGTPVQACTRAIGTLAGRDITTVEGLAGHTLIAAFIAEQAGQCGYCLSGMVVAALDGQLCRCGAHPRILRAVERAARELAP